MFFLLLMISDDHLLSIHFHNSPVHTNYQSQKQTCSKAIGREIFSCRQKIAGGSIHQNVKLPEMPHRCLDDSLCIFQFPNITFQPNRLQQ